jgi:hypothetical protein
MLPRFTVSVELLVFATDQLTGTIAPVEAVAVQLRVLPEETVVAGLPEASSQTTVAIAVGCTRVRLCVAVKEACTWEVAVIVMTLFVGIIAGAVYKPPGLMDPLPVPLTVQFTKVLLRFRTVAVHCEVARTVTSVGVHETVIVGVGLLLGVLPQEFRIADPTISARKKNRRCQRALARLK